MQDLQLIGVHEDGEHLLLTGADGERFQMPIDDPLRAAIRRDRPHLGQLQIEVDGGLRPREVQALIRAGASSQDAATRAGWTVEKVHRYEGPILAEREHVASLAQRARLRSHTGVSSGSSTPTLSARVSERLKARDVEATDVSWDSWRTQGGPWTVVVTFAAGGRQRQASWSFDLADRTVSAVDDEARWLSEEVEEAKGPIPAGRLRPASGRETTVYDLEAEGGLRPAARHEHNEHQDDPLDLMTAMRKRSTARGRRKPGSRGGSSGSPKPEPSVPARAERHPEDLNPGRTDREQHPETDPLPTGPEEVSAAGVRAEEGPTTGDCSPAAGEQAPEPVDKPARQGLSTSRPKRSAREAARKSGRPSVPAWDEIMFGSRPGVDRSSS
jgi:Protein of unknown function (DUF3071)